jgi:hypothetical protein
MKQCDFRTNFCSDVPNARRAADRGEYRQAAGTIAESLIAILFRMRPCQE